MKKKTKLKKLGPASEKPKELEKLNTDHLFTSPVWSKHKPEWVESLNTASDPYIAQAYRHIDSTAFLLWCFDPRYILFSGQSRMQRTLVHS